MSGATRDPARNERQGKSLAPNLVTTASPPLTEEESKHEDRVFRGRDRRHGRAANSAGGGGGGGAARLCHVVGARARRASGGVRLAIPLFERPVSGAFRY